MRQLLYLPIIHTSADLGSLASALEAESTRRMGQERWQRHQQTVARFWEAATCYFLPLAGPHLKIYQDGLPVGGELGRRIVKQAGLRGSLNHQLLTRLLEAGAEVRATEDPRLLAREYELLHRAVEGRGGETLTAQRDRFIAAAINTTLREGELGLLLLGSSHNVMPYLDRDIAVMAVKGRERVNAYWRALFWGGEGELSRLGEELVSFPPPSNSLVSLSS